MIHTLSSPGPAEVNKECQEVSASFARSEEIIHIKEQSEDNLSKQIACDTYVAKVPHVTWPHVAYEPDKAEETDHCTSCQQSNEGKKRSLKQ